MAETLRCVICGDEFVWGTQHGHKKKTCGKACNLIHKAAVARLRYHRDVEKTREREKARKARRKERNPERTINLSRARARAYYWKNRERVLEKSREYHKANNEKLRAREREAYAARRELILARKRLWNKANPQKRSEYKRRYRELHLERVHEDDREAKRRSRTVNPERERVNAQRWRRENPDLISSYQLKFYLEMRAALKWWREHVGHAAANEGPRILSTVRRMEKDNVVE